MESDYGEYQTVRRGEFSSRRGLRRQFPLYSEAQEVRTLPPKKSPFSDTPRKKLEKYFTLSLIAVGLLFIAFLISLFIVSKQDLYGSVCQSPQCIRSASTLLDVMNVSANPCDDFYQFACGNWKASNPADTEEGIYSYQSWVTEMSYKQKKIMIGRLREDNSKDDPTSVRAARRVFNACQDMSAMNAVGMFSLKAILNKLGLPANPLNLTGNAFPWIRSLGRISRYLGQDLVVGIDVTPVRHNTSANQLTLFSPNDSGGIGIFGGWDIGAVKTKTKRSTNAVPNQWDSYASSIIRYMALAEGGNVDDDQELLNAAKSIRKVFSVLNRAMSANNDPIYVEALTPTVMNLYEFQMVVDKSASSGSSKLQLVPFMEEILSDFPDLKVNLSSEVFQVYRIPYFQSISRLFDHLTEKELKLYLWWNVVSHLAVHTNEDLMNLRNNMMRSTEEEQYPSLSRSTICYFNVIQLMGPALGYFVLQEIERSTIDDALRKAMTFTIEQQSWIDDKTRRASVDKVNAVRFHLGVPEWMKNTTILEELYRSRGERRAGVEDGQVPLYEFRHLENLVTLTDYAFKHTIGRLREVNSPANYDFDPMWITVFYSVDRNSITVPYSVLELPLFGWGHDALDYGSIGSILGHELNHMFDSTGRMHDESGNAASFWSKSSIRQQDERVNCLVDQLSNFRIPFHNSTVQLNGNLTMNENMADSGGVKISFLAYKSTQPRLDLKMPGLQNYTNEQLFFLAFAQTKCSKYTQKGLASILKDVHGLNSARTLLTLRNSEEFAVAWNCPKGSFMNPEKKCHVWS